MQNNTKAPSYNECLKWLDDIWDNFKSDVLRRSFEWCGIGNTPNNGTMEIKTDALHSALRKILMSKGQTIPNTYSLFFLITCLMFFSLKAIKFY